MVFSAPIFLFGFLPLVLLVYYVSPSAWKNGVLLIASLVFYAWGEVFYVAVMIVSIVSNFVVGRLIFQAQEVNRGTTAKTALAVGIAINIGLLVSFKYANFITDNINTVLSLLNVSPIDLQPIHLPLGISFFTFQALSYLADVYRKEARAQFNILDLALYISLFPQLIAGPIVRYHDLAPQITDRTHSIHLFSSGVQRFIIGLTKKMLIANPLGEVADIVFAMPGNDLTMPLAWIGVLAYSFQIYFDFSGYSDMAIGLGRMLGFRFLENFNYPYIAKSLREFWRRWHISLSSWFRDYVYIALGGSRVSTLRVYSNLLVVFLLTGIWHGASWNFVVWGLFHGVFLASEHMGFSRVLERTWKPLQHLYVAFVIVFAWVFFRTDTLGQAVDFLTVMTNTAHWNTSTLQYAQVISNSFVVTFVLALIFSMPVYPWIKRHLSQACAGSNLRTVSLIHIPKIVFLTTLLMLSILKVASSTYNPFIYFRF